MGKRGPSPGAKYSRRAPAAGDIVISNNRQLVHAQHFCDRLDAVLVQIERGDYPADLLAPQVLDKLHQYTEAVQHSIIEGIERFYDKNRYE
ncbi:MAG: hypothetical protein H7145_22325 [Akkermansiaceae bacterium]|nr:hypothetical protein [Armatimonadota bacterium]